MTARQKSLEAATRRTVAALRKAGSLEAVDELAVANVLFTAGQLDHLDPMASPAMVASMTRAHLAASKALVGGDGASGDEGATTELLAFLHDPRWLTAPSGDPWPDGQVPSWDH
jgi:hypothetical protein